MKQQLKQIFNFYLDRTITFCYDVIVTFLRFVLHPLQFLFFRCPKAYEILISLYIFIRNSIPTKSEALYTLLHWQYYIQRALLLCFIFIIGLSQHASFYLLSSIKICQDKQKKYLLRY